MVNCNNIYEVQKAVRKAQDECVAEGYFSKEDSDAFISGFDRALNRFVAEYNPGRFLVFETGEGEDEEFGMAFLADTNEWKMVYMSARYDQVRLGLAEW